MNREEYAAELRRLVEVPLKEQQEAALLLQAALPVSSAWDDVQPFVTAGFDLANA